MNDEPNWLSWVFGVSFLCSLLKCFQNRVSHKWDGLLQAPCKDGRTSWPIDYTLWCLDVETASNLESPRFLKWRWLAWQWSTASVSLLHRALFTLFFFKPVNGALWSKLVSLSLWWLPKKQFTSVSQDQMPLWPAASFVGGNIRTGEAGVLSEHRIWSNSSTSGPIFFCVFVDFTCLASLVIFPPQ